MNKRLLLLMLFSVLLCTAGAQNRAGREAAKAEAVKAQIESGDFTINVRQAFPLRGRSVQLSSNYGLTVRGDSIYSQLPYFGRAYSVPYGGGEGLGFDAPITDYKVQQGRKGVMNITFNTRTREDYYQFRITVYPNETASVAVTPGQRQSISFSGNLLITEDAKE